MSARISNQKYERPPNGFRTFFVMCLTRAFSAFGSQLTFFAVTIWLSTSPYARGDQKPDLA
ncbi:MAG: hypothetical protein M3441_12800 [Chloroflexota bacterium]|nr:hypothetical protein [Chloroflexota bacterium]